MEANFPTIHFQVRCYVSFREGTCNLKVSKPSGMFSAGKGVLRLMTSDTVDKSVSLATLEKHKLPGIDLPLFTLPKTNTALENRPSQKETTISNHPCSGAMLALRESTLL